MPDQPVLWDLDFDFFLDSERAILEDGDKQYWLQPDALLSTYRQALRTPVVYHRECLRLWDQAKLQGWIGIHFDAHPDLFDEIDPGLGNLRLGRRGDCVTDGNYLLIALREGILSHVIWVLPDWQDLDYYRNRFNKINPELAARVEMQHYCDFITSEHARWTPQRIDAAFSPDFTPLPMVADFACFMGADEDLIETIVEASLSYRQRCLDPRSVAFMPDQTPSISTSQAVLYHGTSIGDLETLIPSQHSPVFASTSPGFAACFGLGLNDQQGWIHGIDELTEARPFVYLLVPSEFASRLEQPLYLYRITKDREHFVPAGTAVGFEYAASTPVTVAGYQRFERTDSALAHYGVRVYIGRTPRIHDPILLTLVDRYREIVEAHFEMRVMDLVALPNFARLLQLFFLARGLISPDVSLRTQAAIWWRWLECSLAPHARSYSQQSDLGYHGFEHSLFVARVAVHLALEEGINPLPVIAAALLHDAGRLSDQADHAHAELGADIAALILEPWLGQYLDAPTRQQVIEAIRHHTELTPATDAVAACLRDADRLRLAWEQGFDPAFFATKTGTLYARRPAQYGLNQLASLSSEPWLELKFELTEQCNLACAFCHQDFGHATGRQYLDPKAYQHLLTQARDEGINAVRLTGGEPTVLKSLDWYLEKAKDLGFQVTLNTNGMALTPARLQRLSGLVDCFKLSLPAADEATMAQITGSRAAWSRKWEAIGYLLGYGYRLEILTVMTAVNIRQFDDFIAMLEPLDGVRWVPLRAEPRVGDERPISQADLARLARALSFVRRCERWEDLMLGLSVPFCALENPFEAAALFTGGQGCGPVQSLTVTNSGVLVRCYSRRDAVDMGLGLRAAGQALAADDFRSLPGVCQDCGFWFACRGGCRCGLALEDTPFGRLDYLANPARLPERLARALEL